MHTDAHGDTITAVTKKADKRQGVSLLTGDIRVRFPSARVATTSYEHQRTRHDNKDTYTYRLLTYTVQELPAIIPIGHTNEESQDASLHKAYIACQMPRGFDGGSMQQLFLVNILEVYDYILLSDTWNDNNTPTDYYAAIARATEAAADSHNVELNHKQLLFMFEFHN